MLQDIKKVAADAHGEVVLVEKPTNFSPDGVDVFIRYPLGSERVWCAWLMMLPDKCAC